MLERVVHRSHHLSSMSGTRIAAASNFKTLANGVKIPTIGLGVYQSYGTECTRAVEIALETGYRHFDSALAYKNERLVGDALKNSGIDRSELFFTTKLPPKVRGYEATKGAIAESLSNCGLEYLDLYLIHAPYGDREGRLGQWRAIEEAIKAGRIRAGGVSNYGIHHLQELLETSPTYRPQVNQIELHPFICRPALVKFCEDNQIALEAYSPLTRGQRLEEPCLVELATKYGKSVGQLLIRWGLQKGKRLNIENVKYLLINQASSLCQRV